MHRVDIPDTTDSVDTADTPNTPDRHDPAHNDARPEPPASRSRRRMRAAGIAGGVLAALAVWTLAGPVLGVALHVTPGTDQPQPVGVASVIIASLTAGLAGWASLALLEKLTRRARPTWIGLALVVLAASLAPTQAGVTTAVTLALAAMHLAVAAVVISVLAATTSPAADPARHPHEQR